MNPAKDVVDDAFERRAGVDYPSLGNALPCAVQASNNFPFLGPATPVRGVDQYAFVDPAHHEVNVVDFKNENAVQQIDELS